MTTEEGYFSVFANSSFIVQRFKITAVDDNDMLQFIHKWLRSTACMLAYASFAFCSYISFCYDSISIRMLDILVNLFLLPLNLQ